jgi:acetyltransferase-like isoleucine patch superfamily enzyme
MKLANIHLGNNVDIHESTSVNNVILRDGVRIAKRCSIFGGPDNLLEIGAHSYVGMNSTINGFVEKVTIGMHVSIAQNVSIMCDSGPNASQKMQRIFPPQQGPIAIGNHCWIGAFAILMPGVVLGDFCVVAASSFVKDSFPSYSIIGGIPARLIRMMTEEEIKKITSDD